MIGMPIISNNIEDLRNLKEFRGSLVVNATKVRDKFKDYFNFPE
jgi:hypothetical protein